MQRITVVFLSLIICLFTGILTPAIAENNNLSFKSPFSIFSKKEKEPDENKKDEKLEAKVEESEKKIQPKIVYDPENPLGAVYAENAVSKIEFYVEEGDLDSAREELDKINDWIYKATEYHTDLYRALNKAKNSEVQANIERELAIKFAVLRDRTLYLGSKVLLANGKKQEAVKNLVEVVRSQPNTELGFKAYRSLQEIGFTYKLEYQTVEEESEEETKNWF